MVAGFGKFLFKKGSKSSANLTKDVRQTLEAWRADGGPALDEPHFHTRYVVVDVATSGEYPGSGKLEGITAIGMRGGVITPGDAFALDLAGGDADPAAVNRQLAAFLSFSAKAPLVTYHSVFVSSFLQRALQERLGVNFRPDWVNLAWLLPSLFAEKWHTVVPLDRWLELFGIQYRRLARHDGQHPGARAPVPDAARARHRQGNPDGRKAGRGIPGHDLPAPHALAPGCCPR